MRSALSFSVFFLSSLALLGQEQSPTPVRTFVPYTQGDAVLRVAAPPSQGPDTVVVPGHIEVLVDPRVERAMVDHADRKHVQEGYRVQIFLGDRRTAEETKRAYLLKFPDSAAYLSWLAPNFRLRVGDLRTRLEAEHLLREMKELYPGSYIVRDEIEPPALPKLIEP